jgi:hypothetical protein
VVNSEVVQLILASSSVMFVTEIGAISAPAQSAGTV